MSEQPPKKRRFSELPTEGYEPVYGAQTFIVDEPGWLRWEYTGGLGMIEIDYTAVSVERLKTGGKEFVKGEQELQITNFNVGRSKT